MTETPKRYACRVCPRDDLSLTANGRIRSHAANGKRPGPDNPNCPGGSDLPRDAEQSTAPVTASGGPNPYRSPLPTGNLPHDRNDNLTEDPWQSETPSNQPMRAGTDQAPGSRPGSTETVTPAESPSMRATSSGQTETAGTRDRTAAVTTEEAVRIVDAFESAAPPVQRAEQQVERDGWGRYKLHHPETGKKQAWQRATTFAKMLADTFGLGVYQQRMVAKGLSLRPDLLDMVATLEVKRDREKLNQILEQAKDAAGQKVAANQGTVCHKHTEDVDRGDVSLDQVPAKYRADVTAYVAELRRTGITIVPQMIERITVVPDLGVGGTLDRVVMDRFGKYRVLDVKTGNMDFGQLGICIQLALYAHGVNTAGVYDLDTGTWQPPHSYGDSIGTGPWSVPQVETDYALVAHIPVGSGTCELLKVPIDTGWEAVRTAVEVRDWRKVKKLFTPYEPEADAELVGPSDPRPTEAWPTQVGTRPPTWAERFEAVSSRGEAMSLYTEALSALGQGPELDSLVRLGMAKLAGTEERAG